MEPQGLTPNESTSRCTPSDTFGSRDSQAETTLQLGVPEQGGGISTCYACRLWNFLPPANFGPESSCVPTTESCIQPCSVGASQVHGSKLLCRDPLAIVRIRS